MELKEIKIMNDATIKYLKNLDISTKRNEIISRILEDEACFFKMNKEDAYIILKDVGVGSDKIETIYNELVSLGTYQKLLEKGIISKENSDLVIRYNI